MRTITVIGTQRPPMEYQTEATTWGQLKDLVQRDFGSLNGMIAIVKESRVNLESEDAVLPEGDTTLFLTQTKIKAGAVDVVEVLRALKEEYNTAIDEVIERVEAGEFDVESGAENAPAKASGVKGISAEDAAFLAQLQHG